MFKANFNHPMVKNMMMEPLVDQPTAHDWLSQPIKLRGWWLLKIIDHYYPQGPRVVERVHKVFQPETMLSSVPDYDHQDTQVLESLNQSIGWLLQQNLLTPAMGKGEGMYHISTSGQHFMDNEFESPPTISDIEHIHESIYLQIKDKYLLGSVEYRAAITDAYTLVLDRVKTLSGQPCNTGQDISYLRNVFNKKSGVLSVTGDGYLAEYFAGTFAKYRHRPSHSHIGSDDRSNCIEALCAASGMMRELDKIESIMHP